MCSPADRTKTNLFCVCRSLLLLLPPLFQLIRFPTTLAGTNKKFFIHFNCLIRLLFRQFKPNWLVWPSTLCICSSTFLGTHPPTLATHTPSLALRLAVNGVHKRLYFHYNWVNSKVQLSQLVLLSFWSPNRTSSFVLLHLLPTPYSLDIVCRLQFETFSYYQHYPKWVRWEGSR